MAPSTGTPHTRSIASRATSACRLPATWFSTTPAMRSAGSIAWQPRTGAAAVAVTLRALSTSTTGASSSFASTAVLCVPAASMPSKTPRLPSMTFTAPASPRRSRAACRAKLRTTSAGPVRNVSRLRAGAPDAQAIHAASM